MKKLFVLIVIPAIVLQIIGAVAFAQQSYAAVLGKVSDQAGGEDHYHFRRDGSFPHSRNRQQRRLSRGIPLCGKVLAQG